MLDLAIKACLPLVGIRTRDIINIEAIIKHAAGGKVPLEYLSGANPATAVPKNTVAFSVLSGVQLKPAWWREQYDSMVNKNSTLILVNADKSHDLVFDAGEPPVPKKLMHTLLNSVVEDDAKAQALMSALGGCTLKEAAEYARLTMARDHSLTAQGLAQTRKSTFQGSQGLQQVGTEQDYYAAPLELEAWVESEKFLFLNGTDKRLIARGLLFDGPPGTGKTEAAKYIARNFGVPLYRIHVGSVMHKYVGDSEANMASALSQLDNEEPCVALFDEVEKMFAKKSSDSSGVTTSMMSQLLWWMVERKSRVLVLMTTNNAGAIPDELYRPGRIDQVMKLKGVNKTDAEKLASSLIGTFTEDADTRNALMESLTWPIEKLFSTAGGGPVPQAEITKAVYGAVKAALPK